MIQPRHRRFAQNLRTVVDWLFIGFVLLVPPLIAAPTQPAARLFYDLPADTAEKSLIRFSAQSGLEVLFATQVAADVTTIAVHGEFTAMEAASQMLAGTVLRATLDPASGAVTVRRFIPEPMNTTKPTKIRRALLSSLLAFTAHTVLLAQTVSTPAKKPATTEEETIALSPFEVTMTQDRGYTAPNSGLALRTNEELIKIPQSISVITRDMLDDIGLSDTSDVLGYSGLSNFFQGDSASLRGVRVNMLVDGVQDPSFFDPVIVDSLTIVRGPSAVLYGLNASLGGAVIKNTRVPTGRKNLNLSVQSDEWGFMRTEIDADMPLANVGDGQLAIRTDLMHQKGANYFKNTFNDRDVFYSMLQWKDRATTVRVALTLTQHIQSPTRNMFLTPDGLPFIGAGRREDFQPYGTVLKRHDASYRLILLHNLSDNWSTSLRATMGRNSQYQPITLIGTPDFSKGEVSLYSRLNHLNQRNYAGSWDVIGKYRAFNLPMTSSLGLLVNDNTNNPNYFNFFPTFGALNAGNGVGFNTRGADQANIWIPMYNPQITKIVVPQEPAYRTVTTSINTNTNGGSRSETLQTNAYFQQNVELFKDKLILVGSLAQFNTFTENENIVFPTPTTITASSLQRQNALLHRLGLVYRITPGIGIYALDSTSMLPQTSRLIDGTITPPQAGKGRELGFKLDLFDGRLQATAGAFDIKLTNQAVGHAGFSPFTGQTYVTLIGATKQRGADITLAGRPMPNLQLTFNAYKGTVKDAFDHEHLASTFTGAWAIYGRYSFTSDALKKFAIGGGANRQYGRWVSANAILPDGSLVPTNGSPGGARVMRLKDGNNTQMFVDYYVTKHLTLKLSVNNVLDEFFAVGYQSANVIDPIMPRTISLWAKYRF